jgi:hypothetical protein
VTEEIAHRQQTRLERLVRRAGFPYFKTIVISTSRISRPCGSRYWAPRSRPISRPKGTV